MEAPLKQQLSPSVEEILKSTKELAQKQREKVKLVDGEQLINCLYHDSWVFTYTKNGENHSIQTDLSFSELEGITEDEKIYFRSLLVELCGGYQDQNNNLKRLSSSIIPALKIIYSFSKMQRKPLFLELWSMETLESYIKWAVNQKFEDGDGIGYRTLSYGYLALFKVLHRRQILSFKPFGEEKLKKIVAPIIKLYASGHGYESEAVFFADWVKGRNLATVPLEIAIGLLGYGLEVLQSDEVKILESYFMVSRGFAKKLGSSSSVTEFFDRFFETLLRSGVEKYEYNSSSRINVKKELEESRLSWVEHFFSDVKERFDDDNGYCHERFDEAFRLLILKANKHLSERSKTAFSVIHKYANHVYDCMYVLMLCLTGFRYHEIRNIHALDCISKDSTGHFKLKTVIDKTEAGLIERTVHPVIAEVVELLNNLSYIRKDKKYDFVEYSSVRNLKDYSCSFKGSPSLFTKSLSASVFYEGVGPSSFGLNNSFINFTNETATKMINRVWKHASARLQPELKSRLEAKLGGQGLTSHGFRHTWVEFALLNFTDSSEGGVLSGIARKFGYSSKDMTNFLENYISGKFSQAHVRRVETEVTKTLVLRLFGEVVQKAIETPSDSSAWLPEHFKGDMAVKLAIYIREKVEDITMVSEDELYDISEDLVDGNLVRVEANPWGYCILFEDGKQKAACINSKHDIQKENGGAFELCIKCPNQLIYLPVNEEYLQQTIVTHTQVISCYENQEHKLVDFNSSEQQALIIKSSQEAITNIQRHIAGG